MYKPELDWITLCGIEVKALGLFCWELESASNENVAHFHSDYKEI